MKAVTIRVSDVEGVAGFVQPGDRVDIALTRLDGKGGATTDAVLQNATVLAIDQLADERAANVAVAKSVTLEVDTVAAQKLDLAHIRSATCRCCCARPARPLRRNRCACRSRICSTTSSPRWGQFIRRPSSACGAAP